MTALIIVSVVLSVVCVLLLLYVITKKNQSPSVEIEKLLKEKFAEQVDKYKEFSQVLSDKVSDYNKMMLDSFAAMTNTQGSQFKIVEDRFNELLKKVEERQEKMMTSLDESLKNIQKSNENKLDEVRKAVDERLENTLEKRLKESVDIIVNGIDNVSKGVGEMRNIASGMGDFRKLLTNVKTRGGWGEVQLEVLLEQMLSPQQYDKQVAINGNDRVDFVVKMPGKDDKEIFLPIDAKFPMEDYIRICEASENGDIKELEIQSKNLEKRIKDEARKIRTKYVSIPKTTDFAIMYLPVEGLYAEVLRKWELVDLLQREYKILVCGPTSLAALLNSLQMGFKTLTIEKRSSEIWTMLSTFKKEFNNFVELLAKTQKKINEASDTIESATKKTQTIQRKLKSISVDEEPELIMADENDD